MGIGVSYAYINVLGSGNSVTTLIGGKTACMEVTITDEGEVGLTYNYPIEDNFAKENIKPIKVTLRNTCEEEIDYSLIITALRNSSSEYIGTNLIKGKIDKKVNNGTKEEIISSVNISSIKELKESETKTLLEKELNKKYSGYEKESRVIEKSKIGGKTTIEYEEYIWIDYSAGNETQGKDFKSILSIVVNNPEETVESGVSNAGKYILAQKPRGLSDVILGDMYRFVGTEEDVDNFICFGYNNAKTDCTETSEYMYRIIGITPEGEIKVIKNTEILEGTVNAFSMNHLIFRSDLGDSGGFWDRTELFRRLNGLSDGSSSGSDGDTNIFINSVNYPYMSTSSVWYEMITNHLWWFGEIQGDSASTVVALGLSRPADEIYRVETGQIETDMSCPENSSIPLRGAWDERQKVSSKVGLLYIHDIYFAYSTDYKDGKYADCSQNACSRNWLAIWNCGKRSPGDEWILTSSGYKKWGLVYAGLTVSTEHVKLEDEVNRYLVRPTFYLSSSSKVGDGDGSVSKPFIVEK